MQEYVEKVFGTRYTVVKVSKMEGGAQKVVYKLDCSNGFSCILYVWDLTMNYFQEEIVNHNIHAESYGSELFESNNRFLMEHAIRTPILYDLNRDRDRYDFDYALVEYVAGQDAGGYYKHPDRKVQDKVFQQVGEMIHAMHRIQSRTYGKPNKTTPNNTQCHLHQLYNGIEQLTYAAEHVEAIRKNQGKLLDKLYSLESKIVPRNSYGFIHGELGPNHVIVTDQLEPYLIDIEGAEFYDIEHEHSFLEMRFGEYYRYLNDVQLDENRKLFYKFHHHLSLVAGGLKLVHRGFPDQQLAQGIADRHADCALQFIEA